LGKSRYGMSGRFQEGTAWKKIASFPKSHMVQLQGFTCFPTFGVVSLTVHPWRGCKMVCPSNLATVRTNDDDFFPHVLTDYFLFVLFCRCGSLTQPGTKEAKHCTTQLYHRSLLLYKVFLKLEIIIGWGYWDLNHSKNPLFFWVFLS
jgi:hypothetical protein